MGDAAGNPAPKRRKWDLGPNGTEQLASTNGVSGTAATQTAYNGAVVPQLVFPPKLAALPGLTPGTHAQAAAPRPAAPAALTNDVIERAKAEAAAIAAKLNQDAQQKGLLNAPGPAPVAPEPKKAPLERQVFINDLPLSVRSTLTKKAMHDDVGKRTCTIILTRGRYYPPGSQRGEGDEEPLHLLIKPGAGRFLEHEKQQALDDAVREVEGVIGRSVAAPGMAAQPPMMAGPPPALHPQQVPAQPPASGPGAVAASAAAAAAALAAQYSAAADPLSTYGPPARRGAGGVGSGGPPVVVSGSYNAMPPPGVSPVGHSVSLYVGFEAPYEFGTAKRVQGPGGSYLQHISKVSNTTVTLRGRGAGRFFDSHEPLHVHIQAPTTSALEEAQKLASNLIDTVRIEYAAKYPHLPPPPGVSLTHLSTAMTAANHTASQQQHAAAAGTMPMPQYAVPYPYPYPGAQQPMAAPHMPPAAVAAAGPYPGAAAVPGAYPGVAAVPGAYPGAAAATPYAAPVPQPAADQQQQGQAAVTAAAQQQQEGAPQEQPAVQEQPAAAEAASGDQAPPVQPQLQQPGDNAPAAQQQQPAASGPPPASHAPTAAAAVAYPPGGGWAPYPGAYPHAYPPYPGAPAYPPAAAAPYGYAQPYPGGPLHAPGYAPQPGPGGYAEPVPGAAGQAPPYPQHGQQPGQYYYHPGQQPGYVAQAPGSAPLQQHPAAAPGAGPAQQQQAAVGAGGAQQQPGAAKQQAAEEAQQPRKRRFSESKRETASATQAQLGPYALAAQQKQQQQQQQQSEQQGSVVCTGGPLAGLVDYAGDD